MTSPPEEVVVRCPSCGHEYRDWRRASVNVDLDPWADDAYVHQASHARCPACGHEVAFEALVVRGGLWMLG